MTMVKIAIIVRRRRRWWYLLNLREFVERAIVYTPIK